MGSGPFGKFLSDDQERFRAAFSVSMDPALVVAWIVCESGRDTTKASHNYLNVGPGRSYPSAVAAGQAAAQLLNSALYQSVQAAISAHHSGSKADAAAQLVALRDSPWCAPKPCPGYSKGGCIDKTWGEVNASMLGQATPGTGTLLGDILAGEFLPDVSGLGGLGQQLVDAIKKIAELVTKFFSWELWQRILLIVGGAMLAAGGVALVLQDVSQGGGMAGKIGKAVSPAKMAGKAVKASKASKAAKGVKRG